MTENDRPFNHIEQLHYDAITAAGNDPTDWLIESQLGAWQQHHGWSLTPQQADDLRRLSGNASSRFERAEALQLYNIAETCIRTMQQMSVDRQSLQMAQFGIATGPGTLVNHPLNPQVVQSEWHHQISDDDARPPGDGAAFALSSVIWMPVHALTPIVNVAWVISDRLTRPYGDIGSLFTAFTRHLTWEEALETLRAQRDPRSDNIAPPPGRATIFFPIAPDQPSPRFDGPVRDSATGMTIAAVVFMAGHEAGHLYLGHFGDRELIEPITGGSTVSPILKRERDADTIGINAVWDGLESHGYGSIDYTWVGPVLALAIHAGIAAAHPYSDRGTPDDSWQDWVHRLATAIRVMGEWLIGNGFGWTRSVPILCAAVPLAACTYEYVRTGGELADGNGRLGAPGADVYAMLEPIALELLDRFERPDDDPFDQTP